MLRPAIDDLVTAVARIHQGKGLSIEVDVAEDVAVQVDPRDLDELIGNVLDNAARHARRHVIVSATPEERDARRIRIEIGDDGPGIPRDERSNATLPGTRLDERGDGHGFGLSIVSDLARLYGGDLALDISAMGGLLVVVRLPTA